MLRYVATSPDRFIINMLVSILLAIPRACDTVIQLIFSRRASQHVRRLDISCLEL
jgi:uncharacterized membrane protein